MKHAKATAEQVRMARLRHQNPYAFLDVNGNPDAIVVRADSDKSRKRVIAERIRQSRLLQQNPYAYINEYGQFDADIVPMSMSAKDKRAGGVSQFTNSRYDRDEYIARRVREIQIQIWKERNSIWPDGVPASPIDMLDPVVGIRLAGYDCDLPETLGMVPGKNASWEVAGIIDRASKRIRVSRSMPIETLRFTAAHELGHALLHNDLVMHRDRPIDGLRSNNVRRDPVEAEADKFAAYFLLPEKLVRERFRQVFAGMDVFVLTEDTVFAFDQVELRKAAEKCKNTRELSRALAKAKIFNGQACHSLSEQFGVSVETMAIRIEELGLVDPIG